MFTDDMFQNMNTKWGAEGSAPSRVPAGRMLQGRDFPRIGIIIIIIIVIIVIVITISDCKLPEPDNGEGRRMLWDKCSKGELCHGLEGEQPRYGRARCQDNGTRYRNASFSSSSSSWASSWQTASSATWPLSLRMAHASVLIDSSLLLAVLASNSSSKVAVIIGVVIIILPPGQFHCFEPETVIRVKEVESKTFRRY